MAFDMGFDFRGTAGAAIDPAYGVPVLAEIYPNTYTNANGDSINAGWTFGDNVTGADRGPGNDPRIVGINFTANDGTPRNFTIDLASGSAPGAGTYSIDLADGDAANFSHPEDFKILDTATVLIDGTNGGAGFTTTQAQYVDATLAIVTATINWTGTPVTKTFATTMAIIRTSIDNLGDNNCLAHFRLTLQEGAEADAQPPSGLSLLGAGRA